jgi:predicted transcriptional regulator
MSTIKASEETKKRLFKLAGELQSKDGKRKTMEEVINFLIDNYYKESTSKRNSLE